MTNLFSSTPSVSQPFVSAGDTFEVVGYNDRVFTVKSVNLAANTAVFELSSHTGNMAWQHTRTFDSVKNSLKINSWKRGLTVVERLEKELAKLKIENQ